MSMILDALKRAREEGDSPVEVPSIDSTHELMVKEPPSTNALKYLAFGIGLGVLITAGVLVTRNEPPAPDSAVAPQKEKVILPKSTSPQVKALPRALEPARPVTTGNDRTQGSAQNRTQVAELYRVAEDMPLSDSAAPALTVAKGSGAPPVSNPPDDAKSGQLAQSSVSAPNSASSVPLPKVPSDSDSVSMAEAAPPAGESDQGVIDPNSLPLDIAAVVKRVQAELGKPALVSHATPLLENLSQQTKNAIPSVMYTVHDWQPAGRSRVTLNGSALSEGQQLNGFKVDEILTDSVILSYRGTEFRLRALNSWVNL
ncbi:general secretion pathway protein GspB [Luminiphilus sp.]|nr:general secretion pathway protein GspB [Luminiphilus sp.]